MLKRLKQHWRDFRKGTPGQRFQDRYERNRAGRAGESAFRFLKPAAAILLLVAGVVFCLIPGPGLPLLVIGAGLLADVSLPVARVLDRLELKIRALLSRFHHWWAEASVAPKCALVIATLLLVSGAAYGVFRVVVASVLT